VVALRQNLVAPAHAHELAADLTRAVHLGDRRQAKRNNACHAKKESHQPVRSNHVLPAL
jgi:hypothetical protein